MGGRTKRPVWQEGTGALGARETVVAGISSGQITRRLGDVTVMVFYGSLRRAESMKV